MVLRVVELDSPVDQPCFSSFSTHGNDEMCNFYMYYYYDATNKDPFSPAPGSSEICSENQRPELFNSYPKMASQSSTIVSEDGTKQEGSRFGNHHLRLPRAIPRERALRSANPNGMAGRAGRGGEYGVVVNNVGGDGFGNRGDPIFLNSDGMSMPVVDGGYGAGQQYGPRPAYVSHVRKKPGPGLSMDGRVVWRNDQGGMGDNGGRYYYANDFGVANQPDSAVPQPTVSSGFGMWSR